MKKIFYSILLVAGIGCVVASCSKGAYNANTAATANGAINPLTPLNISQFDWIASGREPMSANIDGVPWTASYATWALDTFGGNMIVGYLGSKVMYLYLNQVYQGNIYSMSYHDYLTSGSWSDSVGNAYMSYFSYNGNSGEVYITHNDSLYIQGMFYFKAISESGKLSVISNGYFKLNKF